MLFLLGLSGRSRSPARGRLVLTLAGPHLPHPALNSSASDEASPWRVRHRIEPLPTAEIKPIRFSMKPRRATSSPSFRLWRASQVTRPRQRSNTRRGIRINALVAGGFGTPMLESAFDRLSGGDAEARQAIVSKYDEMVAVGRIGRPEEAAEAAI
jgi:NAD(P)-dependent dehydrogenase (short-subunit alcohol dehydrogenase family)